MGRYRTPGIIDSDKGPQFAGTEYASLLKSSGVRRSMDGKGRWVDKYCNRKVV